MCVSISFRTFLPGIYILLCLFGIGRLYATSLEYERSEPHFYHSLAEEPVKTTPLSVDSPAILEYETSLLEDTLIIDFAQRRISFRTVDEFGNVLWQYTYDELNRYLLSRQAYVLAKLWYESHSDYGKARDRDKDKSDMLEWEMPVHYPKWARRVLGEEPPKLSIHGYEEVEVSYAYNDYDQKGSSTRETGSGAPIFRNNYNITVSGSVGRLIDVNLESNSEQGTDFENPLKKIKIEYKGEGDELEDEIVQEVTAGYTSFNFPGGRLSGYSQGSHEGLFGITSKLKFGPLDVTTALSNEQGEAQQKTFHPNQPSEQSVERITEKEYVKYRYYFLDTAYMRAYNRNNGRDYAKEVPSVNYDLQVWVGIEVDEYEKRRKEAEGVFRKVDHAGSYSNKVFERLEKDEDYYVNLREGWIRFYKDAKVDANTIVGLYMSTEDASVVPVKGDTSIIDSIEVKSYTVAQMDSLWLLKRDVADVNERVDHDAASGFALMWKNVYKMPDFESDFDLKVERVPKTGGDTTEIVLESDKKISYVLGLTDEDGKVIDESDIFDTDNGYIIVPPFDTSRTVLRNQPFKNRALGGQQEIVSQIYDYTPAGDSFTEHIPLYNMVLQGEFTRKKTTFNLGWGVIEGSVEVTADGQVMQKNVDYRISYGIGDLKLISQTATSAHTIKVSYQRETFAAFKNRLFMGLSGTYGLDAISDNSFVGGSILYQVTSTREDIPHLGQETFNKLLLDFNTTFDFTPDWMTQAVNIIPGIATDDESSLKFEFETAHSSWHYSADSKGKAYIDDFESSQNKFVLGTDHRLWYSASVPVDFKGDTTTTAGESVSKMLFHPPAWNSYWFSPRDDEDDRYTVRKEEILDIEEFTQRQNRAGGYESQNESVLRLECRPSSDTLKSRYHKPWCGIMRAFADYATDRRDDKYLKVFVKYDGTAGSSKGKLHIDLGRLSEDLPTNGGPPNQVWDDEDTIGVEDYKPECNTGLDNLGEDEKEFYLIPDASGTAWDTLRYGDFRLPDPEDPAGDNFLPYTDGGKKSNRNKANGLQNDNKLSSEDLNGDGFSTSENIFRYVIDLDSISTSGYLDTSVSTINNWHCLRIPLDSIQADTIIGSPQFKQITHLRFWWDGFSDKKAAQRALIFYNMEFVGNKWEEMPTRDVVADSTRDTIQIDASVINNIDNTNTFRPSIQVEKDRYGNPKREQALRLNYKGVEPGTEVRVKKERQHAWDFSSYGGINFHLYGAQNHGRDSVWFFFRFGTDENTYYEYATLVTRGWDTTTSIHFSQLSNAKLAVLEDPFIDSADTSWRVDHGGNPAYYSIVSNTKKMPSFASVRYMAMGVYCDSSAAASVTGELWIDKLKVQDLRNTAGNAALFSMTSRWSDFMTLNANADYRDGDFRQMNEGDITPQNSKLNGNINADWKLNKFMPSAWNVSIPLNVRYGYSLTRPQLKPGSDISLAKKNGGSDGLQDLVEQTGTPSSHYETKKKKKTASISYRKTKYSDNFLSNLTVDRLSVGQLRYQNNEEEVHKGEKRGENGDYLNVREEDDYAGDLTYDLSPKRTPQWSKYTPLKKYSRTPLLRKFSGYSFKMLPDKLTFDLAEARYTHRSVQDERPRNSDITRSFRLDHGMHLSYSPIDPLLDITYDVTSSRDLDDAVGDRESWDRFVRTRVAAMDDQWRDYLYLYGEDRRSQNARISLKPGFFDWLTHSASYSSRFSSDLGGRDTTYVDLGVKSTFEFKSTLQLNTLTKKLSSDNDSMRVVMQFFGFLSRGIDAMEMRNISFDYSASSDLTNKEVYRRMLDHAMDRRMSEYFSYQLGLKGRNAADIVSGDMDEDVFGGMNSRKKNDEYSHYKKDERRTTRNYKLSTSMTVPKPIDLKLSRVRLERSESHTVTPDTSEEKESVIFPKFGASARTSFLNSFPGINKNITNLDVNSSYEYEKDKAYHMVQKLNKNNEKEWARTTKRMTVTHRLTPLVSVNGRLKQWPVDISYSHDYTREMVEQESRTLSESHEDRVEAEYSFHRNPKNETIGLIFWEVPLQGKVTARMTASHDLTLEKIPANGTGQWRDDNKIRTLGFRPNMNYQFTDNITGQTSLSWTQDIENESETRTDWSFGTSVKVRF